MEDTADWTLRHVNLLTICHSLARIVIPEIIGLWKRCGLRFATMNKFNAGGDEPMSIPTIEQVMTCSPVVVDLNDSLAKAQGVMAGGGFRHVPVVDAGNVVSMISNRDANIAVAAHKGMRTAEELKVEDVCTLQTYMVEPDTQLDEVVTYMADNHIGSTLIARDGRLLGIFTATDACRVLGDALKGKL